MNFLLLSFGIPFLLAGGTALLLDWCRPAMMARRQERVAAGISALGVVGWAALIIAGDNAHPSRSPDAGGYFVLGAMFFGMVGLFMGVIASRLTVRYLRGEWRGER